MNRNTALALVLATAAMGSLGACASVVPKAWLPGPSCDDITFPVYFQEKSDALTPPALQMLALAADKARSCRVVNVEVVGLADQRDASPELSQLRAENVSRALMARGGRVCVRSGVWVEEGTSPALSAMGRSQCGKYRPSGAIARSLTGATVRRSCRAPPPRWSWVRSAGTRSGPRYSK